LFFFDARWKMVASTSTRPSLLAGVLLTLFLPVASRSLVCAEVATAPDGQTRSSPSHQLWMFSEMEPRCVEYSYICKAKSQRMSLLQASGLPSRDQKRLLAYIPCDLLFLVVGHRLERSKWRAQTLQDVLRSARGICGIFPDQPSVDLRLPSSSFDIECV
jgi:hypothetical protein